MSAFNEFYYKKNKIRKRNSGELKMVFYYYLISIKRQTFNCYKQGRGEKIRTEVRGLFLRWAPLNSFLIMVYLFCLNLMYT